MKSLNVARASSRFTHARVLGVALLGLLAGFGGVGCGPKQKFCPDASDGVCVAPMEASAPVDATDANADADSGAIYIGVDAPTGTGAAGAGDGSPAN